MGAVSGRLDPRRFALDNLALLADRTCRCTAYRRHPGADTELEIGTFWARIARIGRQTTGLEASIKGAGTSTETLWVLRVSPNQVPLVHGDEIRVDGAATRYRVIHGQAEAVGQSVIMQNLQ